MRRNTACACFFFPDEAPPPPVPPPPPPLQTKVIAGKNEICIRKIWLGHFWYTIFWVPDPPHPPLCTSLEKQQCPTPIHGGRPQRYIARGTHVVGEMGTLQQ